MLIKGATGWQVLSIQEEEDVEATNGGMSEKARKIVSILELRLEDVLSTFIHCLRKSNHGYVADLLEAGG